MSFSSDFLAALKPEELEALKQYALANMKVFKNIVREHGKMTAIESIFAEMDGLVAEDSVKVSCKKGCSFCCHINVTISEWEAEYIAQYCRSNRISISASYLKQQLTVRQSDIAYTSFSACIFLKNNLCSIYPVRPAACRNYQVFSDPQLCNVKEMGRQQILHVKDKRAETLRSIIEHHCGKYGRLPRMLLKYAK